MNLYRKLLDAIVFVKVPRRILNWLSRHPGIKYKLSNIYWSVVALERKNHVGPSLVTNFNQDEFASRVNNLIGSPWFSPKNRDKHTILFVTQDFPFFDRTGHFTRLARVGRILNRLGYNIVVAPVNSLAQSLHYFNVSQAELDEYLSALNQEGMELLEFEKVRDFLFFRGGTLQAIWLYGQRPAISFLETFRGLIPFNKILLDTIDLEFRRAKQLNQPDESRRLKDELCALIEFCDTTIFISENEAQMCLDDLEIRPILKSAIVLSNVYPDMSCHNQDKIDLSERIYDGIFVGSYLHYPNQQAIKWLIQSILPRVEVGQFIIVGEGLPWEIVKMIDTLNSQADSVHVDYLGHVPNLDLVYSDTKFALAPLLSGAGVKGKVIEALHHGLPVIGTQIAFEGIGEHDGEILFQGEDEESFAEQVNELISLGRKGELFIDLNQVAPYLEKFSEKTATWKIVKLVDE